MEHKKNRINLILVAILAFLLVFVFQNCAPGKMAFSQDSALKDSSIDVGDALGGECNFNGQVLRDGQSVTAYANLTVPVDQTCQSETRICDNGVLSGSNQFVSCVEQNLSNQSISVTEGSSYSPFKLLLIIDNSYTMSQSQAKLAQNIDSLIQPLAGKDVQVKIITTSDVYSFDLNKSYTGYFKADGTSKKVSFIFNNDPEFNDVQYVKAEQIRYLKEVIGMTYNLGAQDSAAAIKSKIDSIKNYIVRLGVSGSDNEQVLCPLAMHLFNRTQNSFFQQGDKAAVVVLSDENDSSTFNDCKRQLGSRFGAAIGEAVQGYAKYDLPGQAVNVSFNYLISLPAQYKDGILVKGAFVLAKTDGKVTLGRDKVQWADVDSGACVAKVQTYLRSLGKVNNVDLSQTVVASCNKSTVNHTFNGPLSSVNLCDGSKDSSGKTLLESKQNTKIAVAPVPSDLVSVIFNLQPEYTLVGCKKTDYQASIKYNRSWSSADELLLDVKSNSEFDQIIKNEMDSLFGEKYFMSFIVNANDNSCALQAGQSVGARYEGFKSINSSRVETMPICSDNYSKAMDKLSQFMISVVTAKYNLNLPADATVTKVTLTRSGQKTILDASKYKISGAGAQIEMMMNLNKGDQLDVEYKY